MMESDQKIVVWFTLIVRAELRRLISFAHKTTAANNPNFEIVNCFKGDTLNFASH